MPPLTHRRWLRGAGYALAALILLAAVAYWWLIPWLVGRQIGSILAASGVSGAQVDVGRLTPWQLHLFNLRGGAGAVDRIAEVAVSYSPQLLWNGRVRQVRLQGVELVLKVREGRIDSAAWSGGGQAAATVGSAELQLPFDRIDLESAVLTLQLPQQTIKVPTQGSLVRQEQGRFQLDAELGLEGSLLHLSGLLGPGRGDVELKLDGQQIDASVLAGIVSGLVPQTRLSAAGRVSVDARTALSHGGGTASLHIVPEGMSLSLAGADRTESSTNVQAISGVLESDLRVVPAGPIAAEVRFGDVGFRSDSLGLSTEQMNGVVALDDVAKLRTQPRQKIEVKRLVVRKMEFSDGQIVFGLNGPEALKVERTRWNWLGGSIGAESFQLNLLRPVLDATVELKEVDLHQLLASFASEKASGQGRISGKVPLQVDWPAIRFGNGVLQAAPGGQLQVKDLEAMGAALEQAGQTKSADWKQRVLEALGDFRFDVLRATLRQEEGGLAADMRLAGRGQAGPRQPLDLELRVHGVDQVLGLYLGVQKSFSATRPGP